MIAVVGAPLQMRAHNLMDGGQRKRCRCRRTSFALNVSSSKGRSDRTQPVVRGDVEAFSCGASAREAGSLSRISSRRMYFSVAPRILKSSGSEAANSTMRWSRNGGRTSSECAMLMRSDLYRMSSGR